MALFLLAGGNALTGHGYLRGSDFDLVKDYLQPAATFALALSVASLPFTLPRIAEAQVSSFITGDLVIPSK